VKLEGTVFNGREPDEDRYDFDFHPLDSYGVRLTANPTAQWALSASYGHLVDPEALHPGEDQHRIGASVLHTARLGHQTEWASALVYGANQHIDPSGVTGDWEHSAMLESNLQLDSVNTVFGRLEYVRKRGDELALPGSLSEQEFDLGNLSLGYVRELASHGGATFGAGVRGAINLVPRALESEYGSRTPVGIALFLRLRPALLEAGHTMNEEMHHSGH
jgi:hypothetical protein